ncbi:hypothetical protein RclHR1_04060006 [Rhizophagus clarus]|uniref:Protein kinase domain-containing protein n=1 Tax=Rhizophagus clarus TaxID=94130 RepID=A0A2Z6REL4_9GLOM|nr:hypothetical protein RclHR1_04060006 [Rhizophagus clarus]
MLSQDDSEHRCDKCNEIYTDVPNKWCKPCNINFFKNNFTNWTSGNDTIDDFIQEKQLGIDKYDDRILEWIPYSQFVDVKEIGKDSYSNATIYSALWNDGLLRYNSDKKESKGNPNIKVALKCLNGSQNIIYEVLDEAENYYLTYGISQNPDTEDYIVVLENKYCEECCEKYFAKIYNKWCKLCHAKNSFANWTSGNEIIDDFIQKILLNCNRHNDYIVREWIPYSQLIDIKELGNVENNVTTLHSALWNDGLLCYNSDKREWIRDPSRRVTLKYLRDSQNLINELSSEIEDYNMIYGISQNPDTKDYILALQNYCVKCYKKYSDMNYKWCKLCYINNFTYWTSGNKKIDNFIQEMQLTATYSDDIIIEWIPYTQFVSIKEIVKDHDNFNTIYSAIWNNSPYYDNSKRKLIRESQQVTLITLNYLDKSCIIDKLLDEIKVLLMGENHNVYGITQNPGEGYIIVCKDIFCEKCGKRYTNMPVKWCKSCLLKNNFINRISGNEIIDNFIQEMQLKICNDFDMIVEWIPYDQFINIKKIEKVDNNDFTVYLAIWKNGPIEFDYYKKIYQRNNLYTKVALKCLNNSQNKINEFLNEAKNNSIKDNNIYGISQNPDTKNYIIVLQDKYCEKCGEVYTSIGNKKIDDYIQKMNNYKDSTVEWIPFDQFINIKEMNKINKNNATIYAAVWKKGYEKVILKCLNNSNNKINELLNEVENCSIKDDYKFVVFGISQNPDTKDYIIILSDYKRCKTCTSKIYLENKWCKLCQVDFFKNNFKNWTSGNDKIDDFIYEMQLKIDKYDSLIFEWIPFNQFINIKKIGKVDNNTAIIYSAIWKDGPLEYNYNKTYKRNYYYEEVLLKYLNNSQNRINEFLNKAESYSIKDNYMLYGISQNPDTKDYIMVLKDIHCEKCNEEYTDIKYKWCKTCQVNYLISCFTNWTSGSEKINNLIQKMQLKINKCDDVIFEWIPYDEFDNIKEVGKGGFATVYSAIWKNGPLEYDCYKKIYQRNNYKKVALKCLYNSQSITDEFLNEIKAYSIDKHNKIMQIYGISQNLDTKNYIIVLRYAGCGNFNNWMDYYRNFSSTANFFILKDITIGLKEIHQRQLVHRDFHIGNILINSDDILLNIRQNPIPTNTYISDMGLCGEVNNTDKTKIYGVMPYVAPEVLRGKTYTKAADIYSFGMIMYFIITGRQPFENCAHDEILALKICRGIRPEIPEISELKSNWYINLMKKCWDSNPDNRPNIESISTILDDKYSSDKEFKEAEQYLNKGYKENGKLTTHPQAIYISRLLNSYTEGLVIDFTELKNEND